MRTILAHPVTKLLSLLATIAIIWIMFFGGGIGRGGFLWPSTEKLVAQSSDGINQDLPMMVGKETRLDSMTAGPGNRMVFNYTLVNYSASELSAPNLIAIEERVTDTTCRQGNENLLSKNAAMQFRYFSADGSLVRDFTINPNTCAYSGPNPSPIPIETDHRFRRKSIRAFRGKSITDSGRNTNSFIVLTGID